MLDATIQPASTHQLGPGAPRLAHAYPEGSEIALCGSTGERKPHAGNALKCPSCVQRAQHSWIAR